MKISAGSVNEARQNDAHRIDEQKTSDRFSQLLKSKNEKSRDQPGGNQEDVADGLQKDTTAATAIASLGVAGADSSTPFLGLNSAAPNPGEIIQPGAHAFVQMDKLTTEISHQIEIFQQQGGAQAVNITFDARTLEGLQVQIRQQDGELAIRFLTGSDRVSKLLGRHSGELREALANRGVKIRHLAITHTRHSTLMQRDENAGA